MPCGVSDIDMAYNVMCANDHADEATRKARTAKRTATVSKKVADAATRAACDLRTILRRGGSERDLTVETRRWIERHDKWDKKRARKEEAEGLRERTRQAGLKKLTLDERRALGL